jgi:hypothetical protein
MIHNPKKRVFYILFLVLIQLGLKAQTTSSIYTLNQNEYVSDLEINGNGDLYYFASQQIKKVSPEGVVSTIHTLNDEAYNFAIDALGNFYYFRYIDKTIQKISPNGENSTFLNVSDFYYVLEIKFDADGNLFFSAVDQNYNTSINKVTTDGTRTPVVNDSSIMGFTLDTLGNIYYANSNSIQKVTPDGSTSTLISFSGNSYVYQMTTDTAGNLYYIDNWNSNQFITKVAPNGSSQVYLANDINLQYVSGLVADSTGALYYINYTDTGRGELIKVSPSCTQPGLPLVSDQSFEDGATVANLMVIGNNIKWYVASTGASALASTTVLTSKTYYVTQTVNDCESNRVPVLVTINKLGLGRYGQITADKSFQISKNGAINAGASVNKYGKTTAKVADGNGALNYETFSASAGHPYSSDEFSSYVNPANVVSSGSASGSVLLNWESGAPLTNAGIAIPNGGEQFAVQVSGFFVPQESGVYTFTCEGDDAVDLFINDVNVANHYGAHGTESLGSHTGTIDLIAGTSYTFRARMQDAGGGEGLRVFWRKPSESSGWNINTNELSSTN